MRVRTMHGGAMTISGAEAGKDRSFSFEAKLFLANCNFKVIRLRLREMSEVWCTSRKSDSSSG